MVALVAAIVNVRTVITARVNPEAIRLRRSPGIRRVPLTAASAVHEGTFATDC